MTIVVKYFVCVCVCVAVVIRHAKRIRRIVSLSVVCPAVHFSTLSHKRIDLKKYIEPEMF